MGKESRAAAEVNTLLNLQVEQQDVGNDAQPHTLTIKFILQAYEKYTKDVPVSGLKILFSRFFENNNLKKTLT